MQLEKAALVIATAVFGVGSPAVVGTHHATKETIADQTEIKENVLPINGNDFDNDWNQLKSNLSNLKEKITNLVFEEINKNKSENQNHLKTWCAKAYVSTYKSWISGENTSLLNDVKTACVLSIKDKLGTQEALDTKGETDKDKFTSHLNSLKTYPEGQQAPSLTKELLDLQNKVKSSESTTENNWQTLREWCNKSYERGYQGDNDLWKLVQKFCKKST